MSWIRRLTTSSAVLGLLLAHLFLSCQRSTENPPLEIIPKAPTNLTATAATSHRIDVSWTDNSADETEFRIQRKDATGGDWILINASLAANTRSYQDTAVLPGIRYTYRVWAYNANGGSPFSNEASASPLAHLEASAEVDQTGGMLEVVDPSSQIFGTRIMIPAGVVAGPSTFSLSLTPAPETALPDGIFQEGPVLLLECSSTTTAAVSAEVPFQGERLEDELRMCFFFRSEALSWDLAEPLPGESGARLRMLLWDSTPFVKGKMRISKDIIPSSFKIEADVVRSENPPDQVCLYDVDGPNLGFTLAAEEYFKNYAKTNKLGLKCWWTDSTSYGVACRAQGVMQAGTEWEMKMISLFDELGIPTGSPSDLSYLVDYWKIQLINDRPTSVLMLPMNSTEGHSVLFIGWEKTAAFKGRFLLYDSQDNAMPRGMGYEREGASVQSLTTMGYTDKNDNSYDLFINASTLFPDSAPISALIASTARDLWDPRCGLTGPRKIAYCSAETGGGDIYVMTVDPYLNIIESGRLTFSTAYEDHPCWSPDGKKIAFESFESGSSQIWVMNEDGSGRRQVTNHDRPLFPRAWSPDQRYIYACGNSFPGDSEVARVEEQTGLVTDMTNVQGFSTRYFDLNVDQAKITFVRGVEYNDFTNQLYVADFAIANNDFVNKVLLGDVTPAPQSSNFSWNGEMIAVQLDQTASQHGLGVVNKDGTDFRAPIPVQNGYFAAPDWIDDHRLIYAQGTEYDQNLYVIDLLYPSLPPTQLTSTAGGKWNIAVFKPNY